jgi:hypothetical protein
MDCGAFPPLLFLPLALGQQETTQESKKNKSGGKAPQSK